ncbi:hypothetical protein [Pedobacter nyackensis]|uniref:hypothetical protein n=1 Tax=Pedobacter nyackensis TaxID=475255 RepID=UPI00292DD085|nr:hypothetical protein [Pedobacter nyackensis]
MTNLLFLNIVKGLGTIDYKKMKTTGRTSKPVNTGKPGLKKGKGYYFHADEDFREDWDWGKSKVIASKAISKPANKFEI